VVVSEAAGVADEVGLDRLTMSAIADRVGVAVPSLYKHVDGIDALLSHLAVHAVDDLGAVLANATVGRSRTDALRSMAKAYRAYATEHPGCYAATVRAPEPGDTDHVEATAKVLHIVEAVLAGYGIRGDDAIDAARALRSSLHGFVSLEAAGGFGLPRRIDRSFDRLIDSLDVALTGWATGRPLAGRR
jgi:AcrR family transcriptional regulator